MLRSYRTPKIVEDLTEKPDMTIIVPEMAFFMLDGEVKAWTLPQGLVGDADAVFEIVDMIRKK